MSAPSLPLLGRQSFQQAPLLPGLIQRSAQPRPVLVIDDDQFGREALARLLEVTGYSTVRAANGLEGLGALRDSPRPGLIILDLLMPVVDGWEFCARKSQDPRLAGVPILVLSAVSSSQLRETFPDVVAHFQKPVSVTDLLAAIHLHWQA